MNDLDRWIHDLEEATKVIHREVKMVVRHGAVKIKKDWQARWTGHPRIKHLPRAIAFDEYDRKNEAVAVIGPDKLKMQGGLGSYIEFGTRYSAPIPGGIPAVEAEEPHFVRAMGDLGEKLLAGRR